MQFAQKLHSIKEMEKNRIEFYRRFGMTIVEPTSAITCENYQNYEKIGKVKISCQACCDRINRK